MELLSQERFYLLWYFSKEENWTQKQKEDINFERPFDIFANTMEGKVIMKEDIEWLIKLKYIKIKKFSLCPWLYSDIIKSKAFKLTKGKERELLKENSFKYTDYTKIINFIHKEKIITNPHHYQIDDCIKDKEKLISVLDTQKIKEYIEKYTLDVLEKNNIIIDSESIKLKDLVKKETLYDAEKKSCKYSVYCHEFEDIETCLKEKIKEVGENDIHFINNDDDYILFLPIMYAFELFGFINIININDYISKGYFVRYEHINKDTNKIKEELLPNIDIEQSELNTLDKNATLIFGKQIAIEENSIKFLFNGKKYKIIKSDPMTRNLLKYLIEISKKNTNRWLKKDEIKNNKGWAVKSVSNALTNLRKISKEIGHELIEEKGVDSGGKEYRFNPKLI